MKLSNICYFFVILIFLAFSGCEKSTPEVPNEEEVITDLVFRLNPMTGGGLVVFTFSDPDGDGGQAPIIASGKLAANTVYDGLIQVLNSQVVPSVNITDEVRQEGTDHQFFFQSSLSSLSVEYDDMDSDGNPIGINTKLTTGEAGSGKLTITLRHEPSKSDSSVKSGNIANAGGETDIEVVFDVEVE